MKHENYVNDAVELLKSLISIPSISRNEKEAADKLADYILSLDFDYKRVSNNIIVGDPHYDPARRTILLNAHIDTVKPVNTWTLDPFKPQLDGDRLYGLGSNDCGGGLVSLLMVFRHFVDLPRDFNMIYVASAEEEVSGAEGFSKALQYLPKIDVAIVGEPTTMQPAIAEKGLMVIDGTAHGKSGHAARNNGVNAIYKVLDDLNWIKNYRFKKESSLLGDTIMTVTMINAGTQHNVIPDTCKFVLDVRSNEKYTNKEIYDFLCTKINSELSVRSFRLSSSNIDIHHPLIERCVEMGMEPFGSPTLSDQALMPFPSFKLGPGQSPRSHSADEYICISEIENAIDTYIKLLDSISI